VIPEVPRESPDFTAHVFAEHGWTDIDFVLSDLKNSVAEDHRADHERADLRAAFALLHSHDPLDDPKR
jgi:hypothetical protein